MKLYGLCNNASFRLSKCYKTLRIVQQCFFSTSGMSQNFTDYLTMGVKYLEVVKRRFHATKQWSLDEIRVWHYQFRFFEISTLFGNHTSLYYLRESMKRMMKVKLRTLVEMFLSKHQIFIIIVLSLFLGVRTMMCFVLLFHIINSSLFYYLC